MSCARRIQAVALHFTIGALIVTIVSCSNRATHIEPPILRGPPTRLSATDQPIEVVHFQAWPSLPGWGVQMSVMNGSKQEFTFDIRPLTTLSGVRAYAVDTKGEQHDATVSQVFRIISSLPGFSSGVIPPGFELITLRPGEAFSWPAFCGAYLTYLPNRNTLFPRFTFAAFAVCSFETCA